VPKLNKKPDPEVTLKDDPRVRDPAMWQRLRVLVEHEAIDRAWGCPLYILNRIGFLTNEQREAGDRYQTIVAEHNKQQQKDPHPDDELGLRRIDRAKAKWRDAINVLGMGRNTVDWLVLQENPLCSERERLIARDALQLLANFFNKGNKTRPQSVV
jgi:hypothetical protein